MIAYRLLFFFLTLLLTGCSDDGNLSQETDSSNIVSTHIKSRDDNCKNQIFTIRSDAKVGDVIGKLKIPISDKELKYMLFVDGEKYGFKLEHNGDIKLLRDPDKILEYLVLTARIVDEENHIYCQRVLFRYKNIESKDIEEDHVSIDIDFVKKIDKIGSISDLALIDSGKKALVASDLFGVASIDLESDEIISSEASIYYANKIFPIDEKRVLVADGYDGLLLMKIDEDRTIKKLDSVNNHGWSNDIWFDIKKKRAMISDGSKGFFIVDLNGSTMSEIANFDTDGYSEAIIADKRDNLFLADGYKGLVVFDLSDENNISIINSMQFNSWVNHLAINSDEDRLYLSYAKTLVVLDISTSGKVSTLQELEFNSEISSIKVIQSLNIITLTTSHQLFLIDINDKESLHIIKSIKIDSMINSSYFDKSNQKLYILTQDGIYIYDLI